MGTLKCPVCCYATFETRDGLRRHLIQVSALLNNLECCMCNQGFVSLHDLTEHLKIDCLDKNNEITALANQSSHITYVDCGAFSKNRLLLHGTEEMAVEEFQVEVETEKEPAKKRKDSKMNVIKINSLLSKQSPQELSTQVQKKGIVDSLGATETTSNAQRTKAKKGKKHVTKQRNCKRSILLLTKDGSGPHNFIQVIIDKAPVGVVDEKVESSGGSAQVKDTSKLALPTLSNPGDLATTQLLVSQQLEIVAPFATKDCVPLLPDDDDGGDSCHDAAGHENFSLRHSDSEVDAMEVGVKKTATKRPFKYRKPKRKLPIILCPKIQEDIDADEQNSSYANVGADAVQTSATQEEINSKTLNKVFLKNLRQVKNFKCPDCHEQFNLKSVYDLHTCPKSCNVCDGDTTNQVNLSTAEADSLLVFKCEQCLRQFEHKCEYDKHPCTVSCDVCGQSLQSDKALGNHMRTHKRELIEKQLNNIKITASETFHCELCNDNISVLLEDVHKKIHNEGLKVFKCSQCLTIYLTRASLLKHEQKTHKNKTISCPEPECLKEFKTTEALRTHVQLHAGLKPFNCSYCHKTFNRKGDLNKHERVHTGEKPHVCETCGKSFRVSSSLLLHTRTHTNERPYPCTSCTKAFKSFSALKFHSRTHGDERPLKCPFCDKYFKTHVALHGHKNSHNKPHRCQVCDRSFASHYSMIKHLAHMHSNNDDGRDKFDCVVCGASYGRAWSLETHLKTHGKLGAIGDKDNPEVIKKMVAMGSFVADKSKIKPKVFDPSLIKKSARRRRKKVQVDV